MVSETPAFILLRFAGQITAALVVATLAVPAAAEAPAKTVDVAALQKLVAGLGLEDTGDKKEYVTVAGQGGNGYAVSFTPSDDKSYVTVTTGFPSVPKDKMALMPMLKMLKYNDTHLFNFALASDKDGSSFVVMEAHLAATAVTPQSIDFLVATADETTELWDIDKWAPANGAKPKSDN